MEQLTNFLAENMYIAAAALYVLGVFLKAVPKIPNWVIPFVLTAAGVVFGMLILAGPAGCSRVSLPPAWPCSSIRAISRLRSRFLKLNRCKRAARVSPIQESRAAFFVCLLKSYHNLRYQSFMVILKHRKD